jgi:hypothetical protein
LTSYAITKALLQIGMSILYMREVRRFDIKS